LLLGETEYHLNTFLERKMLYWMLVVDALSGLDMDDLKIQEEEALTLLSESEHSNVKFPMHTALIFKEQTRVNGLRFREKELSQPHYSMQHIEGYDLLCYKDKIYIPQSLKQKQKYYPGVMNIYFIQDRLALNRPSEIP
jgi:hypothetical protein